MRASIRSLLSLRTCASAEATAIEPHENYVVSRVADQAAWEAQLLGHPCRNIYASWGWGEYKSRLGWRVERLLIRSQAGECLGMAQTQTKTKFGLRFVYIHGGPLFFTDDATVAAHGMRALLEFLKLGRRDLVGINFQHFDTRHAILAVQIQGFVPSLNHAQYTLVVDTSDGLEQVRARVRKKWLGHVKRAQKNKNLTSKILVELAERYAAYDALAGMYDNLTKRKGFESAIDAQAFREIAVNDPRYVMLEVRDQNEIVVVKLAHSGRDRLTGLFSASSTAALTTGANALAVWRMIEYTIESGHRYYDLAGIDAVGNPGVFKFKLGISDHVVQSGPLWLFGRCTTLRNVVGAYLAFR